MKVLLLEDEEPASKRLKKLLLEIDPDIIILETIVSVASAIKWFNQNPAPDIILSDIQLADGTSFEIFKAIDVKCPVIFTTAYDQYAIAAFKLNSIDYLLKPIKPEELNNAIDKFKKMNLPGNTLPDIGKLLETLGKQQEPDYRKRFIVRYGEHIKTINTEDIAFFYTEDKVNFLTTTEGRRFAIDYNLDALDSILDPKKFFRINRQYIISIHSIKEMFAYSKSRVLVKLNPEAKHETIVSTERSADFKLWLGDEA